MSPWGFWLGVLRVPTALGERSDGIGLNEAESHSHAAGRNQRRTDAPGSHGETQR